MREKSSWDPLESTPSLKTFQDSYLYSTLLYPAEGRACIDANGHDSAYDETQSSDRLLGSILD